MSNFDPSGGNIKDLSGKRIHDLTDQIIQMISMNNVSDFTIKVTGVPAILLTLIGVSKEDGLAMIALNWDMFADYAKKTYAIKGAKNEDKK